MCTLCLPQCRGSPAAKAHTGLQRRIPWGFLVPLLDPQAGNPDVGLRTFTVVGELLWLLVLQFVRHPLAGMGFDFIIIAPLLPSLTLLCLLMWGVFFCWFQRLSVAACSAGRCGFRPFPGGVGSCPSAILFFCHFLEP